MLSYLPKLDVAIWFIIAAGQIALASILYFRQKSRDYPAFTLYVYFTAIATVGGLLMGWLAGRAYFWGFYAGECVMDVFMVAAMVEIYRTVYGPRISLPSWVPRNVAVWLVLAVTFCACMAVLLKPINGSHHAVVLGAVNQGVTAAACVSLWCLVLYAWRMGFYWPKGAAGIAVGLVLCLSINAVTLALIGLGRDVTVELARRIGQLGYLASLGWWGWKLWEKEPEPEELTTEMLATVRGFHDETMEAYKWLVQQTRAKD